MTPILDALAGLGASLAVIGAAWSLDSAMDGRRRLWGALAAIAGAAMLTCAARLCAPAGGAQAAPSHHTTGPVMIVPPRPAAGRAAASRLET